MAASMIFLFTCLLVGAVLVQTETAEDSEILKILETILGEDDIRSLTTKGNDAEGRQKRSLFYGRGGCGVYPRANVNFIGCFNPGRSYVNHNHLYQNYYRSGDWGSCQNYFRALPLTNIATVGTGYVGHISTTTRSYTVNACNGCYGGNPGISIRSDISPYNYLTRQFVFQPGAHILHNGFVGNGCAGSWC